MVRYGPGGVRACGVAVAPQPQRGGATTVNQMERCSPSRASSPCVIYMPHVKLCVKHTAELHTTWPLWLLCHCAHTVLVMLSSD